MHSVPLTEKIGVESVTTVLLMSTMDALSGMFRCPVTSRVITLALLAPLLASKIRFRLTFATMLF